MQVKVTIGTSIVTGKTVEFHEPIIDDVVGMIVFPAVCKRCLAHPCKCFKYAPIVQTDRQRIAHRVLFG